MKLFTPGPIAMDDETIAIGGTQAQYFRTPAFSAMMLECEAMLRETMSAPNDARMIFLTASGTAAMEATVMNMFGPADRLLVVSGGTFGRRFKQICEIHHVPFESIDLRWNETFTPQMLDKYENAGFTGMLVNMCETSTGQLYPMDSISAFCKRNHICLVLDAISSFLCDPFSMKEIGADAVIISSQKGLALHPGMSFIAVSKQAFDGRCAKSNPETLYFDFKDYAKDIERGQTPYTPAVGIINQLHDKLRRLLTGGITSHIRDIADKAAYFREQLLLKTKFSYPHYSLSNGITPVYCPENNAAAIFDYLQSNHHIYVTPCAGELAPILFRVAHMSRMLTKQDITDLIDALKTLSEERV